MFKKGAIVFFVAILGSSCIRGKPTEIISTTGTDKETSATIEISIIEKNGNEIDGSKSEIVPIEIKFKDTSEVNSEEFRKIIDDIVKPYYFHSDDSVSSLSSFPTFEIKSFPNDVNEKITGGIEKEFKLLVDGQKAVNDETSKTLIVIPDAKEESTAKSTNEDSSSVIGVNYSHDSKIAKQPDSKMKPSNESTVESKSSEPGNKVPESSAGFVANDDFKLAVKDVVKSAVSEVISELILDVAEDILHYHNVNKLLKFES